MTTPWQRLTDRLVAKGGVGTPADARAEGVSESTWHRRTRDEGYARPYRRVRVAPWAPAGPRTDIRAALAAAGEHAVVAGLSAVWLAGVGDATTVVDLVVPHGIHTPRLPTSRVRLRQARWLRDDDVRQVDGIPCLQPDASVVSLAGLPHTRLRAVLIDVFQAGLTTADRSVRRLATVGPIEGRRELEGILQELGGRRPESWFHDIVLTELVALGYPAESSPRHLVTTDGRGVTADIPLTSFRVAVEPEGDRYHRSARARRNDRRRAAQVASTDWAFVPVDWRDWHDRREWVLDTLDAVILRQLANGHGDRAALPPHLRTDTPRQRSA